MANVEKHMLTEEGKKKYEEELQYLIDVVRPQVTQEIKEAKEQGDLSENADYDAARNRQGEVEARITYLQNLPPFVMTISPLLHLIIFSFLV